MASSRPSATMSRSTANSVRSSLELEEARSRRASLDEFLKPAAAPGVVAVAASVRPDEVDGREDDDAKGGLGGGGDRGQSAGGAGGGSVEQRRFPPWLIIGTWILLSTAVIFYNVLILRDYDFPYPITLTTLHLAFQTVSTQLLARYTSLVPTRLSPPSPAVPGPSRHDYLPLPNLTPSLTPVGNGSSKPLSSSAIRSRLSSADLASLSEPNGHPPLSTSQRRWYHPRPVPRVSSRLYWRRIVPIGVLFSASLALSNAVYLFLSVAFIQMIKAASPIAVLLSTFLWGLRPISLRLIGIVVLISVGIGIASYGEVQFSWVGFGMQSLAIAVEANRVVLIQMLLQGENAMTPLESLFHFAPVCFFINAAMILPLEGWDAVVAIPRLGPFVVLTNAATTLLLNLSAVYLIQLSSLVLSLSKVVKDLILIFGSGLVLGTPITPLQWVGYGVALVGLVGYKMGA